MFFMEYSNFVRKYKCFRFALMSGFYDDMQAMVADLLMPDTQGGLGGWCGI